MCPALASIEMRNAAIRAFMESLARSLILLADVVKRRNRHGDAERSGVLEDIANTLKHATLMFQGDE